MDVDVRAVHEGMREDARVVLIRRAGRAQAGVHRVEVEHRGERGLPAGRNEPRVVIQLEEPLVPIRVSASDELGDHLRGRAPQATEGGVRQPDRLGGHGRPEDRAEARAGAGRVVDGIRGVDYRQDIE